MGKDPLVGQVLHDTHRIIKCIGKGGMGAVYEAAHVRLKKQRFAIKVLHSKMVDNDKIFARFQREAEIATEVGHPSIVYVTDFYETDDGRPCMVMEHLDGEDLGQKLERDGKVPLDETLHVVEQVASALQAVHDKGVVHRDMKPANVFLVKNDDGEPRVKVLDFGISKIKHSNTQLTGEHSVLGTPHYMSPEQGEGSARDIDHRTDIFALGTICYQMLSGLIPFDGPTLPGVIYKICHAEPEPLGELVEELPAGVQAVVEKAMAKKREERYQRAADFMAELKAAVAEEETEAGAEAEAWAAKKEAAGEVPRKTVVHEDNVPPAKKAPAVSGAATVADKTVTDEVVEAEPADVVDPNAATTADSVRAGDGSVAETLTMAADGKPQTLVTLSETSGEQQAVVSAGHRRGVLLAVGAGLGLVLALGLVVLLRGQGQVPASTAAVPAPAPALVAKPSPAAKPAPPAKASILLRVHPRGAVVSLDGKPTSLNPLVLPNDGKIHRLRVEAAGHITLEREVRAQGSQTQEFVLTKQVEAAAPKKTPRTGARKKKKKPSKALPFGGDLDEGDAPAAKKKKKKATKATPFSGDL